MSNGDPARHYLPDDAAADDDLKPERGHLARVRAWLIGRSDDDPVAGELGAAGATWWRLYVELDAPVLEVFGEFEEVLKVARAVHTEEYFVWSRSRRTYVQMEPTSVHIPS